MDERAGGPSGRMNDMIEQTHLKSDSLKAALGYAKLLEWSVFPLHYMKNGRCTCNSSECTSPGKHPITHNGFKSATTDETTIKEWFTKDPQANIGIATGAISGFFVLDVDPRHGGDRSLELLIEKHGQLPHTVEAETGGAGRHILFKHREGVRNKQGKESGELEGIDIRGDGGYIVVAPSNHESGGAYEWELSSRPVENEIAETPQWLLDMIIIPKGQQKKAQLSSHWVRIMQGVSEGNRNEYAASLAGHLFTRYVNPHLVFEIMKLWNETRVSPPLEDSELKKIVKSIASTEQARRNKKR